MSRKPVRRGIRAVEVLVLIVCLGLLLALLLPALQSSSSRPRPQCNSNLHSIALALQNYHDFYRVFPMGARHSGLALAGNSPREAGLGPSWWVGLLPFLNCRDEFDRIMATQQAGGPEKHEFCANDMQAAGIALARFRLEEGRCPQSPLPPMETSWGPILLPSYVGISGGCDIDPTSQDYQIQIPDHGHTVNLLAPPATAQIYRNKAKGTGAGPGSIVTSSGMLPPCQHVRITECLDGTTNTMIVAEQSDWLQNRNARSSETYHGDPGWTVGGTGAGGGWLSGTRCVDPVPAVTVAGGPPAPWGADCWNLTTVRYPPQWKLMLGVKPAPGCSENHGSNNPLQSAHGDGFEAAMTDGSVLFITVKIDLTVLLRLAIRDDGQPVTLGGYD